MKRKKNWLLIVILLICLLAAMMMIWSFTSQSGKDSNADSTAIAKYIENNMANHFVINRSDYFWQHNINELVRKAGHFIEYFLLGSTLCIVLNVLCRRVGIATAASIVFCPVFAYIDEFRQNFVPGRTGRWFDWKIDVTGAVLGILLFTAVFLILRYIQRLKARIAELERPGVE